METQIPEITDVKKTDTKKTKVTEPWKPASLLQVNMKSNAHRGRWCRADELDKKRLEGWEPVKWSDADAPQRTILDSGEDGTYVKKRNLVFCRITKEMAAERDAYYTKQTDHGLQSTMDEFKQNVEQPTGRLTLTVT